MIIGVDGNEANVDRQVGVSVYALNLLRHFQKIADGRTQFRIFLRESARQFLPPANEYFRYVIIKGRFFWSQLFLPLHLAINKPVDVFFSPAHYAPRFCPVPLVVTIHDLSYFYYPDEFLKKDLYKLQNWTEYSVRKAKKIIAVSKTTMKDLVKHCAVPENKISVIYNGYEKLASKDDASGGWEKNKPYILYVGTLQPRKNINTLIDAFDRYQGKYPEFKLVITGKKGWLYDRIFQKVKDVNLTDKIIFTDFVTDSELANLYQNAFCFVLPSLYEGFGIPILEAMSYGCPVISSFTASIPEVGNEACLYFDPNNAGDLVDKIELLNNDKLRNNLIKKGMERIRFFSWKKCAEETLQVISSTIDD